MKKISAVFISVVMIVCSITLFPLSAAAVSESTYNEEALLLQKLGIIERVPDELSRKREITRAEFIMYLGNYVKADDSAEGTVYFYDVQKEHYAFKAISVLTKMNIISPAEDGLFRPNDTIKVNEALKFLLSLAGYGDYARVKGGYPLGYVTVAAQLDIDIPQSVFLNAEDAVGMLYDISLVSIYEGESITVNEKNNNTEIKYSASEDTLLVRYYNVYKTTAVITQANGVFLVDKANYEPGKITADGVSYLTDIDFSDNLGRRTTFFYEWENDYDVPEIIYRITDSIKDSVIDIDIDESFISFNGRQISYHENDKKMNANIPDNVVIVKNGCIMADNNANAFDLDKGNIRLIDTYNTGNYNYILIDEYKNIVVKNIDTESFTVYDAIVAGNSIDLDEKERTIVIRDSAGNVKSFSDIETNTVLSYYETPDYIRVIINSAIITGKIFEISSSDGDHCMLLGKNENEQTLYKIDSFYYDNYIKEYGSLGDYKIETGVEITYYLDINGNVAYIQFGVSELGWRSGYLVGHGVTDKFQSLLQLKVFMQDGKMGILDVKDKVVVDGIMRKSVPEVLNDLNKEINYGKTLEKDEDAINGQLIRYRVNADGVVTAIDTERVREMYEGRMCLHRTASVQNLDYVYHPQTFNGQFARKKSTVVFYVPSHADLKSATDDDFFIPTNSWFTEANFRVESFKIDEAGGGEDAIVLYNNPATRFFGAPYLVESMKTTLGNDGDLLKTASLCMLINGARSTATAQQDKNFAETTDAGVMTGIYAEPGDIIRLKYEPNGRVSDVEIVFDYSRKDDSDYLATLGFGPQIINRYGALNMYDANQVIYAYVKGLTSETVQLMYSKPQESDYTTGQRGTANYTARRAKGVSLVYYADRGVVVQTSDDLLSSAEDKGFDNAEPYWMIAPEGVVSGVVAYK